MRVARLAGAVVEPATASPDGTTGNIDLLPTTAAPAQAARIRSHRLVRVRKRPAPLRGLAGADISVEYGPSTRPAALHSGKPGTAGQVRQLTGPSVRPPRRPRSPRRPADPERSNRILLAGGQVAATGGRRQRCPQTDRCEDRWCRTASATIAQPASGVTGASVP